MHDTHLKELAGRTVLVTGGAGLIGSRITAYLRRLRAHPVALCTLDAYPRHVYRDLFGIDAADPDVITGSIQDPALVKKVVGECDYVIHAAALADVAACTRGLNRDQHHWHPGAPGRGGRVRADPPVLLRLLGQRLRQRQPGRLGITAPHTADVLVRQRPTPHSGG